jgi:hypothetical protein
MRRGRANFKQEAMPTDQGIVDCAMCEPRRVSKDVLGLCRHEGPGREILSRF